LEGDRFEVDELAAQLDRSDAAALHVRLTGRSTSREAGRALAPLFDGILRAVREEARAPVLHFEGLDYFNSSTIAALVRFIRAAREAGVPLTVVYDPAKRWQALSFDALRRALRPFAGEAGPALRFEAHR
jgi:hypothetical protein